MLDNTSHIMVEIVRSIKNRLDKIELMERAEQAGAIKAILFANLPVAGKPGSLLFVTNARKIGEGAGSGTGTIAYDDGSAWRRASDDSTLAV